MYDIALSEVKLGKKSRHWIWFIFPQLKGLGKSFNSNYYGIDGYEEADEYIKDKILGTRLRRISRELYNICVNTHSSITNIMGVVDSMKVCSCMTLFDIISPNDVFDDVLHLCFSDARCKYTLATFTNDCIVKSITDLISTPSYELFKKELNDEDIIDNYDNMIRKGTMKFEKIPLCFMADAWCLLNDFAIEDGTLVAYAFDYHSGPPDYVSFNASELPKSVLESAYNIMKKK